MGSSSSASPSEPSKPDNFAPGSGCEPHASTSPPPDQVVEQRVLVTQAAVLAEMPMGWQPRAQDFPNGHVATAEASEIYVSAESSQPQDEWTAVR